MGTVSGCFGCLTLWFNIVWTGALTYCLYSVCVCEAVGACINMWIDVCPGLCDLKSFIQRPINQKMVLQWDGLVNVLHSPGCRTNTVSYVKAIRFLLFFFPSSDPFIHLCCSVFPATRLINASTYSYTWKYLFLFCSYWFFLSSQTGIVSSTRVSEK